MITYATHSINIIPYMNTTTHGCVRKVPFRAGGEWLCALGGQQTQNDPPDEYEHDLLAEPIGIFDLKIIANGNSLIFFFFLPQPIMFVDYV